MANFRVQLSLTSRNMEQIQEVAARLRDFSVPLSNIISEWAKGNVRKFAASVGAEQSGADEPPAAWEPVTEAYYREKHGPVKRGTRLTFSDWLMVRTGELRRSLTERGGFAEYFDNVKAIFGTPLDSEDEAKASYNFAKRPTVFLGRSDRLMVRREFQNYLNLGEGYRELLFARAAGLSALRQEMTLLDTQFGEAASE